MHTNFKGRSSSYSPSYSVATRPVTITHSCSCSYHEEVGNDSDSCDHHDDYDLVEEDE